MEELRSAISKMQIDDEDMSIGSYEEIEVPTVGFEEVVETQNVDQHEAGTKLVN